ncbi:MAG TPA: cytochrome c [Phycisphaeraceae bacterium]
MRSNTNSLIACLMLLTPLILVSCGEEPNMRIQPRIDTLAPADFFTNGTSARQLVEGAIPVGPAGPRYTRFIDQAPSSDTAPAPDGMALLERGRQRFAIWCSPCHGLDGYGEGIVPSRGFPQPPSFHTDRLRSVPDSYLLNVITNGLGKMPPYGQHVPEPDRRAIVAYLRALQLSQHAPLSRLPADLQSQLMQQAGEQGGLP